MFIIILRLLVVIIILAAIGFFVYLLVSSSKKIKKIVDPEEDPIIDQFKEVSAKATQAKSDMKAAEQKLQTDREELEEYFPEKKES